MEEKFTALVAGSTDYRDYDKLIKLITPSGAKTAVMRGAKRAGARLRFAAMPFAFCEFTAAKKSDFYTITGASQIENLFDIAADTDKLIAGSLILEAAFTALRDSCQLQFVYMLKRLKEIIYGSLSPYLSAIRFIQYIIHDAGYGYEYKKEEGEISTPLKLLSALWFLDKDNPPDIKASKELVIKTLIKIIENFEKKFESIIASKKLIVLP